MRTTTQRHLPRALASALVLALLAALLLAGSALAAAHDAKAAGAKPGKPTAKAPKGTITSAKPTFKWSKVKRATRYEVRVYKGKKLLLKKTGLKKTSWKSTKALPKNVSLTWKVRARNARGAGAWSKGLAFKVVPPGPSLKIGDAYGGGIVAWIDETGAHGLIAATVDQTPAGSGIQWALPANQDTSVTGALGTAIGSGAANTTAIIAQNGAGRGYAAGLARAYAGGGYDDWFLPSKDELKQLYQNREAIGGFGSEWYWSSSQHAGHASYVWAQHFGVGTQSLSTKHPTHRVRAVRAF